MANIKNVAIIGSGAAGLASAVRMAVRGYQVDVYEAADTPGGKLSEYRSGSYRYDAGPSLFTMPQYMEELFELAGKSIDDYFRYQKLEVICNYFWEDGATLTAWDNPDLMANEVENKLGISADPIRHYLAESKAKYELTGRIFLEKSLHKTNTWLSKDVLQALVQIPRFDLFKTMNDVHEQSLKHPKLVQLFNRYATYNGSNPYKASGMLTIVPHLEYEYGAYLPQGGMISISRSLYQLAKDLGVQFHFGHKVNRIIHDHKSVSGIEVNGAKIKYDKVICNMDVFFAYTQLLSDAKKPQKILSQEKSSSALIFYWGVAQEHAPLHVHNIFFSNDYNQEFKHISNGTVSNDPTVYIHITSKIEKSDAPEGHENWFTMINVPYNSGQNWDRIITEQRENIKAKIKRMLPGFEPECIRTELILDPRTIESRTQSHLGALYGTSSNDRMAAFFRHPNFSPFLKDLFFCGGSAHPGGGIPLCLLSARIVDELMHPTKS